MPIAYSYIRFSTAEQQKGDSLRRQTELSTEYAAKHGLTLDTSLHLYDEGVSAYDKSNVARGNLGGFLRAIEEGRIAAGSYLLVESLDRLSRAQVMDALQIFLSILKHRITIVTLADGMVYNHDDQNISSLIISITIMARAHEESLMKSRRIKAAWDNKRANAAEKKLTAQCPKWMQLNDKKTEFELIPERVQIVHEIIHLAKNGMGQAQIAKRLNEREIPVFSKHGTGWHSSYIHKILTSTVLYGEFQPGFSENGRIAPKGDPVPNYYPALISKEEFFLLQRLRSERTLKGAKAKKGTTVPNLFSGVAKCGYCGGGMVLVGATAKRIRSEDGKETRRPAKKVLVCDGARRGLGCYAVQWGYKDFEKSFLTFCRGLELDRILKTASSIRETEQNKLTLAQQLDAITAEIDRKNVRLQNLLDALESGETPSSVMTRIKAIEAELDELKEQREKLEGEFQTAESIKRQFELAGESIRNLIDQMESLDDQALFLVRAALADHIRRYIEIVKVFPAGRLFSLEQVQRIRADLLKSGFPENEVDDYLHEAHPTSPKRQGRGVRGRYASRAEIGRHFVIETKGGDFGVVYPKFDDPASLQIELPNWVKQPDSNKVSSIENLTS